MQFVQISSAPDKIPNWLPPAGRWKQQGPTIWLKWYSWCLLTFWSVPCVHSCTSSASALGQISLRDDPTQSGECEVGKPPAPGALPPATTYPHFEALARRRSPTLTALSAPFVPLNCLHGRGGYSTSFLSHPQSFLAWQCGNTPVPSPAWSWYAKEDCVN